MLLDDLSPSLARRAKAKSKGPVASKAAIRVQRYTSYRQVPAGPWQALAPRGAVGLELAHLAAIEDSRINELHPYYLIGSVGEVPVGIAYCFAIDMDLTKLGSTEPPEVLATIKAWRPDFMNVRLVELGFLSSLGTALLAKPEHEAEFLAEVSRQIDEIAVLEDADLAIVRDVPPARYEAFRPLADAGYCACLGFPVARMALPWQSFDEYLAALRGDKRSNLRRKMAKLHADGVCVSVIEDYAPLADRLFVLWDNVARRKSDYEHERISPAWFAAMASHLRGRSHVITIERDGEILAFALGVIGDDEYFWAYVGMEYELRDTYELYFNLVCEGIRAAIGCGKQSLNLGITTYNFKTFVGAELCPVVYMVKALKNPVLSHAYADMFRKGIVQPENTFHVFKDASPEERVQPRAAAAVLGAGDDPRDIFRKQRDYVRTDVLKAAGVYAFFPEFEGAQEPIIRHRGRDVVMLGTNSYLGLGTHQKLKAAAIMAIERYGTGCSGSPLLNGTLDLHVELGRRLAQFVRKEDALIFSTGYQTNLGVISALVGEQDVLVMDERNHASLIDGARLSRAKVARYAHADPAALEAVLAQYADRPKLVVTDTLFSMEGTVVDLPAIVALVQKYGARLMLDESHALGVMGPTGRGVAEHYGLLDEVDVIMGTFSKSFASVGGFLAGPRYVIEALRHTARSHIFSASLPPSAVAAVLAAMDVVDEEPKRRTRLLANAEKLATRLTELGYEVRYHGGAIVPLHCGNELIAATAFRELFERGVFVNPVFYPAVPKGEEMLRLSVMATLEDAAIDRAVQVFSEIRTSHWPQR